MELTVLGCAGSHTGPGRVCSGYLVEADGTRVLVDCGNGSTANLQRLCRVEELDAIVVTHRHPDHCIDLVGIYHALRHAEPRPARVPLHAAPEVVDTIAGLLSDGHAGLAQVFDVTEVRSGDVRDVGPMRLTFADSVHSVPTLAVAVEHDGRRLVYSSDSAGGPGLVDFARGADLLLCEATWQGDAADFPPDLHLTARGAGEVARAAGVARLVLTHVAGSLDPVRSVAEAAEVFDGPLGAAVDLRSWVL
ncbi:MBL fold metallo-hydrolase [Egicoccus halophilus]|uniref:MBL fold metallo-hydrolase n=1 Tax=Egicoccus halophilus TaxID=1670830 RepID=A0A8J3EYJ5_9ACTN|nr:MBL fold metallo-hydrolase [Egicoccus halophilus]GGI08026.1 MBL fold metallo-hydrolase [Egicoccus halophilus]